MPDFLYQILDLLPLTFFPPSASLIQVLAVSLRQQLRHRGRTQEPRYPLTSKTLHLPELTPESVRALCFPSAGEAAIPWGPWQAWGTEAQTGPGPPGCLCPLPARVGLALLLCPRPCSAQLPAWHRGSPPDPLGQWLGGESVYSTAPSPTAQSRALT